MRNLSQIERQICINLGCDNSIYKNATLITQNQQRSLHTHYLEEKVSKLLLGIYLMN